MGNPVNLTTLRNNKRIFYIVGFVFGALIAFVMGLAGIGIAAKADSSTETSKIIGGAVMACAGIGGGIYLSFLAYNETTDRKNEIKCNPDDLNIYYRVKIPNKFIKNDAEYDTDIDISDFEAGRKVQQKNYGGVFLKSNNAPLSVGGNYDAIYIPGDAKAVILDSIPPYTSTTQKDFYDRLYVQRKGLYKVKVIDATKSPIPYASPIIEGDVCLNPVDEEE